MKTAQNIELVEHSQGSSFQKRGFFLVKNFCSKETANLMAESIAMLKDRELHSKGKYHRDKKSPLAFSNYGHFDFALRYWTKKVSFLMDVEKLVPLNSYSRIYEKGATLTPHVDQPQLELSVTLCLKRDTIPWLFCIEDSLGTHEMVEQEDGDAILYRGSLLHWREGAFLGNSHTQVFLHYCHPASPYANSSYSMEARLAQLSQLRGIRYTCSRCLRYAKKILYKSP